MTAASIRCIGVAVMLATARAAAAQSLALTPAEIRASFKPQQVLQFDLDVSNEGDTPVPMRGSVTDLWFDPNTNEKIFGAPGTLPRSAANWIVFVPPTLTVAPHGTSKVKVVITPPAETTGGAYAVLFLESKPEPASGTTANGKPLYANMRLGALILLSAEGTEDYRVEISEPALTPPSGNRNLELTFQLTNAGNTHIFPDARLTVMDASKRIVARADGERKRFFPGQKEPVKLAWAGSLPPGEYTALLTIGYGKDKVYTEQLPLRIDVPIVAPIGP
jgi:hypothetical protein